MATNESTHDKIIRILGEAHTMRLSGTLAQAEMPSHLRTAASMYLDAIPLIQEVAASIEKDAKDWDRGLGNPVFNNYNSNATIVNNSMAGGRKYRRKSTRKSSTKRPKH
jgi:hypothetical protein